MKIIPETEEDVVKMITAEFRTFGGGQVSSSNPLSAALKDNDPAFAAGVDVSEVVRRVIELNRVIEGQG